MSAFGPVLRIAWRNLGRNRRRTLITGVGIALGAAMCIGAIGILDGLDQQIVTSVTEAELGHVQVHSADYLRSRSLHDTFDPTPLVSSIVHTPHVVGVTPRIYGWGFATKDTQSAGVQLMGVDPAREPAVTKLLAGTSLPAAPTPWKKSVPLTDEQRAKDAALTKAASDAAIAEIDNLAAPSAAPAPDAVRSETRSLLTQLAPRPDAPLPALLGAALARKLHVSTGDTLDVISEDANGVQVDVELRVVGTLHTSSDVLDRTRVVMNWRDLQRMLALDAGVHELAIRVDDPERAAAVADVLHRAPPLAKLDVEGWKQLRPDALAIVGANDALSATLVFLIFLVAGLGVTNTMLMSILERKREFGVLKALGMRPATLMGMVVAETVFLATAAATAGLLVGFAIDEYLLHVGLHTSHAAFSLAGANVSTVLHAAITAKGLLLPVVALIGMALLTALYPAISAARVQPAVGMRDL
ncbi:MAG TPA: FtsX-like permease family protein [Kofleriaceae bacterium]|nr:FtsX-like permease family protein [Kofleriaceae bacterium]